MSTQAPWFALAVDWQDSKMFDGVPPEVRLAWICLLCHAKTNGRAGTVKLRVEAFCKRWQITKNAALVMLERAAENGAIVNGTDEAVSVVNWRKYQDPKHRSPAAQTRAPQGVTGKRGRFSKTPESATNDATHHPSPITHHPVPFKKNPKEDSSLPTPQQQKQKTKARSTASTQAEILYRTYPRHVGKAAALKAIAKAIKDGNTFAELLPKVDAYANSPDVQAKLGTADEQFIPHPATWFNQERWMDEKVQSRASKLLEGD